MTTQTDGRRVAVHFPAGTRSVLRSEAVRCNPSAASPASSGGEVFRSGAVAPHPPSLATQDYADGVSWPTVKVDEDTFLMCGQRVDVISMPSGLAGEVNNSLKQLWLVAAVLEITGTTSRRWAFFCQTQPPSITSLGSLELRGVTHHGGTALFQLPPDPTCNSACLRWICPPLSGTTMLPLVATVIACAQIALQR